MASPDFFLQALQLQQLQALQALQANFPLAAAAAPPAAAGTDAAAIIAALNPALATLPGALPLAGLAAPVVAQDPAVAIKASMQTPGQKVKTQMCRFYPYGTCSKGEACAYAHTEMELGKPVVEGGSGGHPTPANNVMRPGDWICSCGNHNFASRIYCNSCGKLKEGKKPGDWMCSNCRAENDSSRETCQKCNAAKATSNLTGKMEAFSAAKGGPKMRSSPYGKGGSDGASVAADQASGQKGGWWDEWSWSRSDSDPLAALTQAVAILSDMAGAGNVGKGGAPVQNFSRRDGDWTCECGNYNFESRVKCNKHSCGKIRPGFLEGDWLCRRRECKAKNGLTDQACTGCGIPRPATF